MAKPKTTNAIENALTVAFTGKAPTVALAGRKITRRVTVPLKLLQTGDEFYARIEGEISGGEATEARKGFDKAMVVVPVIDLQTGESLTLIVSTVLESALKRVPGGYVGKEFLIIQGPKMPGKRYFQIELFELGHDAAQKAG